MRYFRLLQEMNLRARPNGTVLSVLPEGSVVASASVCRVYGVDWAAVDGGYVAIGKDWTQELTGENNALLCYRLSSENKRLEDELLLLHASLAAIEDKVDRIKKILS